MLREKASVSRLAGRRWFLVFSALAMILATLLPGSRAGAQGNVRVLLTLEGRPLETRGILVDDLTMVPLEALGADLVFEVDISSEGKVTVSKGGKRVTLWLGRSAADVNGHEVLTYGRPTMLDGQLLVPVRFLLESLGYKVTWQGHPEPTVDLKPIEENDIIIGTVRKRMQTETLQIDVQYPWIYGLPDEIQEPINDFFAGRVLPIIQEGRDLDAQNAEYSEISGHLLQTVVFLDYRVACNQKGLLSVVLDDYLYSGGAHGITRRYGYTVNLGTGKVYTLADLFREGTDYVSLISEEVARQIAAQDLQTLVPFETIREDHDFYVEDGYLVIYFQQYELMPYAWGFPEFRIPLESLADVLVPELADIGW